MESKRFDLIVIGGGILGAFHTFHALRSGLSVKLIERSDKPIGASVRNFGQVVPSGLDRSWQRFGRESLEFYRELQAQSDFSIRNEGTIYIASDEEELTLIEQLSEINRSEDYTSKILSKHECLDRYPNLRSSYCVGGLFFPEEVSVNPSFLNRRLHEYLCEQDGYESAFGCAAVEVTSDENRACVRTADGTSHYAEQVIVCNGADLRTLFPEEFNQSDLVAVKLQMLRLAPQSNARLPGNILTGLSIRRYESFSECAAWDEIKSRELGDTFEKRWGIHILFKQDQDGSIILGDSHEYQPAARTDQLGFELNQEVNDFFVQAGKEIFELDSWNVSSSWYGVYCQTSSSSGIFRKSLQDRVHVITGIGGKGMTSSAGYAKYSIGEIFNDATRCV